MAAWSGSRTTNQQSWWSRFKSSAVGVIEKQEEFGSKDCPTCGTSGSVFLPRSPVSEVFMTNFAASVCAIHWALGVVGCALARHLCQAMTGPRVFSEGKPLPSAKMEE